MVGVPMTPSAGKPGEKWMEEAKEIVSNAVGTWDSAFIPKLNRLNKAVAQALQSRDAAAREEEMERMQNHKAATIVHLRKRGDDAMESGYAEASFAFQMAANIVDELAGGHRLDCDVNDLMVKGKPCNCSAALRGQPGGGV